MKSTWQTCSVVLREILLVHFCAHEPSYDTVFAQQLRLARRRFCRSVLMPSLRQRDRTQTQTWPCLETIQDRKVRCCRDAENILARDLAISHSQYFWYKGPILFIDQTRKCWAKYRPGRTTTGFAAVGGRNGVTRRTPGRDPSSSRQNLHWA